MQRIFTILVIAVLIAFVGCSQKSSNPMIQEIYSNDSSLAELPALHETGDGNRQIISYGEIAFDLENNTATVTQSRDPLAHFNVTLLIPAPQIDILSFDGLTGTIEVDLTVKNPNAINPYDVRLIIFTDSVGHMLMNPDNWTDLYDQPGGLPINPFKAYAKEEPNRAFGGPMERTERLYVYLPAGNPNVKYAIDASFPNNCQEAYMMTNFIQRNPLQKTVGSTVQLDINVYDWQSNVQGVYLHCPVITNVTGIPFTKDINNPVHWYTALTNMTGASPGQYDAYVVAYDQLSSNPALYHKVKIVVGNTPASYAWTQVVGGEDSDYPECIAVDDEANVYVAGYFYGDIDLDPSSGIYQWVAYSEDYYDAFVAKYNQNGWLIWAKAWGNYYDEYVNGIAVDNVGNVYVVGEFTGTVDFDPGPGEAIKSTSGSTSDCYLSKFDQNGIFQYVKTWGGIDWDSCHDIVFNSATNKLYLSGGFRETVDFDPGDGNVNITSSGGTDHYLLTLNLDGEYQWVKTWGSGSSPTDIAFYSNQIFVVGTFGETVDFDPGPDTYYVSAAGYRNTFVTKFLNDGSWQWVITWGGSDCFAQEIALDNIGNIHVGGGFQGTCDFDPGPDEDIHSAIGDNDAYFSKFTNNGSHLWTVTWGGSFTIVLYGFDVDNNGNVYTAGVFYGSSFDFDPGSGTDIRNSNYGDMFISSFDKNGNYQWAYTFGDTGYDVLYKAVVKGDSLYTLGYFENTMDFDPTSGVDIKSSAFEYDYDTCYQRYFIQ